MCRAVLPEMEASGGVIVSIGSISGIVSDPSLSDAFKTVQIGQVESNQPDPAKPLFAEIVIKPRTDLKRLKEVLVLKK